MCFSFFTVINSNLLKYRLCSLHTLNFLNQIITAYNNPLRPQVQNQYMRNKSFATSFATITMDTDNYLFQGNLDGFNGVTVNSLTENCKIELFPTRLQESLKNWLQTNRRAVWFKVALEHSDWVPVLAKNGFDYHHAKEGFVTMFKWLPKTENNVPKYSHTMVGVGAVVVNDKFEVLLVREKFGFTTNWKLPGGYIEPGENIIDAAIREVYEETHIETEFRSVLSLRHAHGMMFGCSDIYVVVCLKPLSNEIKKCEREIAESTWMDINEYLNNSNVHELNKFFVHSYLENEKNNTKIDCKHGLHQLHKKPYTVYFVSKSIS